MAQDIRDMFRDEKPESQEKLNKGHEQRFMARLDNEMPVKKTGNRYFYFSIAAVLVVALGNRPVYVQ
jgi:uncharacterized protein (DUF2267 family)